MIYPEIVLSNERYRGPREARKQTNKVRDVHATLERVRDALNTVRAKRIEFQKSVYDYYDEKNNEKIKEMKNDVVAMRGGE